jgi:photosystem I subunit 11
MQTINPVRVGPHDPRDRQVIYPGANVEDGNLSTPINSSTLTKTFINNLPAYREGLSPLRRGLEVGMAHGYWLIGPFAKLGPLRDTEIANLAGLLSAVGLIVISSLAISLYAWSKPPAPTETITTPNNPSALATSEGWNEYGTGFLIGGIGGAAFAYFLISNLPAIGSLLGN